MNVLIIFLTILSSTSSSFVLVSSLGSGESRIHHTIPPLSVPNKDRVSWTDRVCQLIEYRRVEGHTLVPKRYEKNPGLANWVSKQRQEYRKYSNKQIPSSLTEEKIRILDEIGFCWDASSKAIRSQDDEVWWAYLEELRTHKSARTNLPETLKSFLRDQRKEYDSMQHALVSKLDENKLEALRMWDVDWWKTSRERQWDVRYQELEDYRGVYGDCCVPINHSNRQLANWVSNLRKQNKLRSSGKPSSLTDEKIRQLNAIGFVWDRWEYEFNVKNENGSLSTRIEY